MMPDLSDKEREMVKTILDHLVAHRSQIELLISKMQEVRVLADTLDREAGIRKRHMEMMEQFMEKIRAREAAKTEYLATRLTALLESEEFVGVSSLPGDPKP